MPDGPTGTMMFMSVLIASTIDDDGVLTYGGAVTGEAGYK
jgi:hypothetical protein